MMQVVIDIPDEVYEQIKDSNTIFRDDERTCYEAVKNGTPLPKGYGDLIDSQELIEKWDNLSVRGRTEFDQVIMCMSPIIEADKESE